MENLEKRLIGQPEITSGFPREELVVSADDVLDDVP